MRALSIVLAASLAACAYEPDGFPCATDGTCPAGWSCEPQTSRCLSAGGADAGATPSGCAKDHGGCDPNAVCSDGAQGPSCQCKSGFSGDGLECLPTGCPPEAMPLPAGSFAFALSGQAATVSALCLDTREATMAEYDLCVRALACAPLTGVIDCDQLGLSSAECGFQRTQCKLGLLDAADHPVNCVTRAEAEAFCGRLGKRLPSDAELEWAARAGRARRTYPWGEEAPSANRLNACGTECRDAAAGYGLSLSVLYPQDDGFPATAPSGSFYQDRNPYGHVDLAGNVSEWTSTTADFAGEQLTVVRGGNYLSGDVWQVSSASREGRSPLVRSPTLGFRCAQDL